MSHGLIAALFAAGALVALAFLIGAIRQARASGDFDASTVLTFAAGVLLILPDALVAVTGTLQRRPDIFGNIVASNPSWYGRVTDVTLLALAVLAVALIVIRARTTDATVHAAALLGVFLWGLANLASALNGGTLVTARGGVLLLCLLAAAVLPRGRGAALGAGIFGVLLAAAGGLLSIWRYDVAFIVPCAGACNSPGFTGVLPNENLLGIVLTAAVPLAYLGFRGKTRLALCLYLVAMAAATGSRTAGAGSIIVLAALVIVRPNVGRRRTALVGQATAWLVLAASIASSVYIVRHRWPQTALTTRPELWTVAWRYIAKAPWFGYGPERWASLYQASEIPIAAQRTTHNQWTDVLFIAGGLGAVVFVCMAAVAILTAGRARTGAVLILATVLLIGTTEGSWSIGIVDLMSFSLLAFLLTGDPSPVARRSFAPSVRRVPLPAATG
jgi:O-antigen ligase